jgi:hypothetical protein
MTWNLHATAHAVAKHAGYAYAAHRSAATRDKLRRDLTVKADGYCTNHKMPRNTFVSRLDGKEGDGMEIFEEVRAGTRSDTLTRIGTASSSSSGQFDKLLNYACVLKYHWTNSWLLCFEIVTNFNRRAWLVIL